MSTPDDFDWFADPAVVLHEQPPIAVSRNETGAIVIRMGGDIIMNYDQTVIVLPEHAVELCRAILAEAGLDVELVRGDSGGITEKKPAPMSNAERQRRFKEKQRRAGNDGNDEVTNGNDEKGATVTDHVGDAELPFRDLGAGDGC